MNKRWSGKKVYAKEHCINEEVYKQLLEELAMIVYDFICQQYRKKIVSTESSHKLKRTGTDG